MEGNKGKTRMFYFTVDRTTCKAMPCTEEEADYAIAARTLSYAGFMAESAAVRDKKEKSGIFSPEKQEE